MKYFSHAALAAVLGAGVVAAASDVHTLGEDTFETFVKEHDLVLAEFFAPWCGHCKALAPEYEEAATSLKEKDIHLAKIDCTEEAKLCEQHGIEGYPTLKVFRGPESVTPYGGARKAPAIISYMTKQSLPAVSLVDKDTIEEFKVADKIVVVGYFDTKDTKSNDTFTSVANTMRDHYLFGATSDTELAKSEGVKQPGVVLYKQFDDGKDVFAEKFTSENIAKFAKAASIPLVGNVGPETYADYMSSGIPLGYIFAETPEEREALAEELKPVAVKHKGKINLATIDAKQFGGHASNLNLEQGNWPAFAIQNFEKNTKFPLPKDAEVNAKDVGKFVDDFVKGKIEPSVKSEPIPETQEGPVTVIVGHSYNDIVMDNKKDVLVEYYAPWCGHCKSLAPKYEELATLFAPHAEKAVIAKVDATMNDVPEDIRGFPTIKLFPAGKKDASIEYQGARTVEDLAEFMRDNGTHGLDVLPEVEGAGVPKTEDMQHQAPAATVAPDDDEDSAASTASEAAAGAASVVSKAAAGAAQVVEAATGSNDDTMDDHDEL